MTETGTGSEREVEGRSCFVISVSASLVLIFNKSVYSKSKSNL